MAKLSHWAEYLAMRSLSGLACLPGPKTADRLGASLGSLAHLLLKSRRKIASDNLAAAMGDQLSETEIDQIVKRVFQNTGRTMFEIGRFRLLGKEGVARIIESDYHDTVAKVYAEGKGAIMVTPHFGNWELMGAWIAAIGYPMDELIGTLHNPLVNDLMIRSRKELGVGIISLAKSMRSAFKALRDNHFTGISPDQHASAGGIVLDFFGRPASMAKGPALLSVRTGAPLLPMALRRVTPDHHVLLGREPVYPPESGDEEADIRTITKTYFKFFEDCIREYPDQWLWTHRRWKQVKTNQPMET